MNLNLFIAVSMALALAAGCKSSGQGPDSSELRANVTPSLSEQVIFHQNVIQKSPVKFGQEIRENDLEGARMTAETMYKTLEALESGGALAAQICFGGSEVACSTFRRYMSQDIKSLYEGFVMSNSLSTGELLKIAAKIEASAALHYR